MSAPQQASAKLARLGFQAARARGFASQASQTSRSWASRITPAVGYHLALHGIRAEQIVGSGPRGMLLKGDVLAALKANPGLAGKKPSGPLVIPAAEIEAAVARGRATVASAGGNNNYFSGGASISGLDGGARFNPRRVRPQPVSTPYVPQEGAKASSAPVQGIPGPERTRRDRGVSGLPVGQSQQVSNTPAVIPLRVLQRRARVAGLAQLWARLQADDVVSPKASQIGSYPNRSEAIIPLRLLLVRAAALALREVPELNAVWSAAESGNSGKSSQKLQKLSRVNLAFTVASKKSQGGASLETPVVRGADRLELAELHAAMVNLAARAVNGQQQQEEEAVEQDEDEEEDCGVAGFTVANASDFRSGLASGVPAPQVAALTLGRPQLTSSAANNWANNSGLSETELLRMLVKGSVDVAGLELPLSLSADARAVSEEAAERWLQVYAELLENPELLL